MQAPKVGTRILLVAHRLMIIGFRRTIRVYFIFSIHFIIPLINFVKEIKLNFECYNNLILKDTGYF